MGCAWRCCYPAAALLALVAGGCGRPSTDATRVSCADPVAGCRFELAGKNVVVRFSEAPQPMRPFVLEVNAPGAIAVAADFSMQDMEMLPNRYQLARTPDGHWQARVVLPACVSGRSDWQLALTIGGDRVAVPFAAGS